MLISSLLNELSRLAMPQVQGFPRNFLQREPWCVCVCDGDSRIGDLNRLPEGRAGMRKRQQKISNDLRSRNLIGERLLEQSSPRYGIWLVFQGIFANFGYCGKLLAIPFAMAFVEDVTNPG